MYGEILKNILDFYKLQRNLALIRDPGIPFLWGKKSLHFHFIPTKLVSFSEDVSWF